MSRTIARDLARASAFTGALSSAQTTRPGVGSKSSSTNAPRLRYPQVDSERPATLRVVDPNAESVGMIGDGTPLTRDGRGVWTGFSRLPFDTQHAPVIGVA